jgi:hypothetical protein
VCGLVQKRSWRIEHLQAVMGEWEVCRSTWKSRCIERRDWGEKEVALVVRFGKTSKWWCDLWTCAEE